MESIEIIDALNTNLEMIIERIERLEKGLNTLGFFAKLDKAFVKTPLQELFLEDGEDWL